MTNKVRLVSTIAGMTALESVWADLLGRSNAGPFVSFAWAMAWWDSFGVGKQLYIITVADETGRLVGIAPLMLGRSGPIRKLEVIGAGLSDAGDFLLDKECAMPVAEEIFRYLRRRRREWDLFELDEVPAYSPLAGWLWISKPTGMHILRLPRTDSPYIPLPSTWEAYIATLHRKSRQHLESFALRVVQETGATFKMVKEEADVPGAVERFYQLHRARWTSKEGVLDPEHLSPAFLPFLHDVCRRSAAAGSLRLAELWVGETVISSWISFYVNGRLHGYMTGFDPAWSRERPGKLIHRFVVRDALAEGAYELDFGRGDEAYKFEMGAVSRTNSRFVLGNNMPRSLAALALLRLSIAGRDRIKRYREEQADGEG